MPKTKYAYALHEESSAWHGTIAEALEDLGETSEETVNIYKAERTGYSHEYFTSVRIYCYT